MLRGAAAISAAMIRSRRRSGWSRLNSARRRASLNSPSARAGLLGARHLVDAVVEQGDVDPLARFQQLLQGDDLLRAVVTELAVIGYCDAVPELCQAAGQHRRNGLLVARPHPHHCRAAEAQDAHRLPPARFSPGVGRSPRSSSVT